MRRLRPRRPSPAMVVALVALFVALGGVSYGVATGSIDSREIKNNTVRTKDLRNNDVRGKDIRNSTIRSADIGADQVRGPDVKESTLGLVPAANLANLANLANRANSAGSVDKLKTVGSYKRVTSSATGADQTAGRAAASEVPLMSFGAFDVYGKCYVDSSGPTLHGEVFIRTKESGSIFDSDDGQLNGDTDFLNTDSPESAREMINPSTGDNSATIDSSDHNEFVANSPGGTGIEGAVDGAVKKGTLAGGNGIYGSGDVCIFTGHIVG
jgi:hypothetical protein